MAGTTDFVPFGTQAGALVEDQAAYVADPQTALGQQDGIADPANANKAWRQGTFQAAVLATFVADVLNINVPDDGNLATAIANLEAALKAYTAQYSKEFLTTNTTFYVATTGNDTTGTGSSSLPWATLQHAYDFVQQFYDLSGFTVTINVANGTYTNGLQILSPTVGGIISFVGSPGSPDSVIVSVSNANCFESGIGNSSGGVITLNGFKLAATGSSGAGTGYAITAGSGGVIGFENVDFGTCATAHIWTGAGGLIYALGPYTISGGATYHWLTTDSGGVVQINGVAVTLTGTPAFTTFANAQNCGDIICGGNTFVGFATTSGARYSAIANGVINTSGGGSTYLPGSTAGSTASGGQYV